MERMKVKKNYCNWPTPGGFFTNLVFGIFFSTLPNLNLYLNLFLVIILGVLLYSRAQTLLWHGKKVDFSNH